MKRKRTDVPSYKLFLPESVGKMKKRYGKAVERVLDFTCAETSPKAPERRNIFDFQNGLRIVVSRDRDAEGLCLHVSASMATAGTLSTSVMMGLWKRDEFWAGMLQQYREISGDKGSFEEADLPPRFSGVAHWRRKLDYAQEDTSTCH
jgi:hypothetical protein